MAERSRNAISTDVDWPLDETKMYATMVKPSGAGPFPAIVMVAGSGPTDRDWNTPLLPGTNGSARLLADVLAELGFASLRYDKRAAGPHAAETFPLLMGKVSFQSHVDELASAVRFLVDQGFVDPVRIFALTNSEGGLHALNYQVHDPAISFAGMILTAPPGRVMSEVGRGQIVAQLAGVPNGAELIAAYDAGIAQFQAGEPVSIDPALPEGVQMLLQGLSSPANLPFARELWLADAAPWLAQIAVPVLVVNGKKDIQVDWQADGERLQQAVLGHENVEFVFPENANHVLKHEPTPRHELSPVDASLRYNSPDAVLDPEAVAAITGWLTAR